MYLRDIGLQYFTSKKGEAGRRISLPLPLKILAPQRLESKVAAFSAPHCEYILDIVPPHMMWPFPPPHEKTLFRQPPSISLPWRHIHNRGLLTLPSPIDAFTPYMRSISTAHP